jgi:phosphatidylglycerophosphate synthase
MSGIPPSGFTRELIDDLSNDRFRIRAWRQFLSRSWQRSLEDIRESPVLTRSFLLSAAAIAVPGVAILLLSWWSQPHAVAIKSLSLWLSWYLLAAAFVLTHLGMSDDGAGHNIDRFSVPNQLSFMRLALAPLILLPGLALPAHGLSGPVFALFAIFLALTDLLDGWIARYTNTCSRLGQMLDYLGDIAFLTFLSVGLYIAAAIPVSLLWLLLLRYPMSLVGALVLYFIRGPAQLGPTTFGRVTTLALSVVLLLIALEFWLSIEWLPSPWLDWTMQSMSVLVGANLVYLVYRGATWNTKQRKAP